MRLAASLVHLLRRVGGLVAFRRGTSRHTVPTLRISRAQGQQRSHLQVVEWVATIKDAANKLKGKAGEFARVLHDHLPELTERYGVKSLGLFGSYVRGEETEGSDLDLLVEFAETPDLLEFVALGRDLSELLGVKLDLVMKRALKTRIGERILEEVVAV